jgi:regulatory protein
LDPVTRGEKPYRPGRVSKEKALEQLKHYCSYQERSHLEVRQRSQRLGLSATETGELLAALIEAGYLNEQRFALQFASGKFRLKGWGKQKIGQGLKEKGVSPQNIRAALDSLDDAGYRESFNRQALKKWQALKGEKNIFAKKAKWRNWLLQKGFSSALIQSFAFPETPGAGPDPG